MSIGRRDLLKLLGGSAVGLAFTPVPWKLVGDSAKWTQNWSWNAVPPRGEVRTRFTACSLCPAGCAVRARCIGDQPISLAGVAHDPFSNGALCALGVAGHHLAYHPSRFLEPVVKSGEAARWSPVSLERAIGHIAARIRSAQQAGKSVVILDERPGRAISQQYRRFLGALPGGLYVVHNPPEARTLAAISECLDPQRAGQAGIPLGFDFENTRTILSIGAPLFDGWGSPGRMAALLKRRGLEPAESRPHIIQAEAMGSRTAMVADTWLPIRPGTEFALVLGLAHVLVTEKLYDANYAGKALHSPADSAWTTLVQQFDPARASQITGVNPEMLVATARELAERRPSIVIGGGDAASGPLGAEEEVAIGALNFLLGNVGRQGGVLLRGGLPWQQTAQSAPESKDLDRVPDTSIGVLLADATSTGDLAWTALKRKLDRQATIVSLSPYNDTLTQHASFCLPAPGYLEGLEELDTPPDSTVARLALSVPLLSAPSGAVEPVAVLARLAKSLGKSELELAATSEAAIKERAEKIVDAHRGELISYADGKRTPVAELKSADELWKALQDGAAWIDTAERPRSTPRFRLLPGGETPARLMGRAAAVAASVESDGAYPLWLVPTGSRGALDSGRSSPVMSKLYQESDLRLASGEAGLNPATARAYGVTDGSAVRISTPCGSCTARVRLDPALMPGLVEASLGPHCGPSSSASLDQPAADLCAADARNTWRVTPAKLSKA